MALLQWTSVVEEDRLNWGRVLWWNPTPAGHNQVVRDIRQRKMAEEEAAEAEEIRKRTPSPPLNATSRSTSTTAADAGEHAGGTVQEPAV